MYKKGFNDVHPKVAWALEGLAKAHQKNGEYREAQAAWEEAIAIRNQVQEASTGKQLFSAELEKAQKSKETLEEMRAEARGRMRKGGRQLMRAALLKTAVRRTMKNLDATMVGVVPLLAEPLLEGGSSSDEPTGAGPSVATNGHVN